RNVLRLHRPKSPRANVQDDLAALDTARPKRRQQRWGEMQARGGRRHTPHLASVDGLVTVAVGGRIGPPDVRGERHVAVTLEGGGDVTIAGQYSHRPQGSLLPAGPFSGLDEDGQVLRDFDLITRA